MNIVRSTHWRCWTSRRTWLLKSSSYRLLVTVQLAGVMSSKKNGPSINIAVIPHHTVTSSDRRGNVCSWDRFSVSHILHFTYLKSHANESGLRQTAECSMAIHYPLPSRQEIVVQNIGAFPGQPIATPIHQLSCTNKNFARRAI